MSVRLHQRQSYKADFVIVIEHQHFIAAINNVLWQFHGIGHLSASNLSLNKQSDTQGRPITIGIGFKGVLHFRNGIGHAALNIDGGLGADNFSLPLIGLAADLALQHHLWIVCALSIFKVNRQINQCCLPIAQGQANFHYIGAVYLGDSRSRGNELAKVDKGLSDATLEWG